MAGKPSKKWRDKSSIYRWFAKDHDGPWAFAWHTDLRRLDFGDDAALEMFVYESRGGEKPSSMNGFSVGKHWMDWQQQAWRESADRDELLKDDSIPADVKAWIASWWT
jgi:hypothetical protein